MREARYALEKIRNPQYNIPYYESEVENCGEDKWKMLQAIYVKECQHRCETRKVFPLFYQVVDSSNNYRKSIGNPMKKWDDKDYEGSDHEVSIKEKYIKYIERYLNRLKNARKMPYNLDLEKIEVRKTELKNYFSFELKRIYNLLGNWKVEEPLPGYWEGKNMSAARASISMMKLRKRVNILGGCAKGVRCEVGVYVQSLFRMDLQSSGHF